MKKYKISINEQKNMNYYNWKEEIINILKQIKKNEFYLSDVYDFEEDLRLKFPNNYFIRAKIRQQLQLIRDQGLIEYLGDGKYKKNNVIKESIKESDKLKTDFIETRLLQKTDNVVQYGNDSIEVNNKEIINCKKIKVFHPNQEIQELIDIIADGTVYQISEKNESNRDKADAVKTSTKEIQKVDTFILSLKRNIENYNGPLTNLIKYTPDFYELFESLLKEKKFEKDIRVLINSVVAYFVLPDDVIPEEKYGAFGYIDDLYLCVYSLEKLFSEKDTQ